MSGLSEPDVLRLWEQGLSLHPVDRAQFFALCATDQAQAEDVCRWPLGRRDTQLMELRRQAYGERLPVVDTCPHCGEAAEFELDLTALLHMSGDVPPPEFDVSMGDLQLRLRLPDTQDMACAASCTDLARARQVLLERCVLSAARAGVSLAPDGLDASEEIAIGAALAEADPLADVRIAVNCPVCADEWLALLDINAVFWQELQHEARQVLRDVHTLAGAYGWTESEVLALSPTRRMAYLAQVAP